MSNLEVIFMLTSLILAGAVVFLICLHRIDKQYINDQHKLINEIMQDLQRITEFDKENE